MNAVGFCLFCNDVDCPGHSIRAVKNRRRAAKYFNTLYILFIIEIGNVVGVYACKLGLSVEHHKHSACPVASDAAQFYVSGSAIAPHSKSEYATLCHKQTRHLS